MQKNYLDKLMLLKAHGLIPTKGYHDVYVCHDDHCPALKGRPECVCDPDILLDGKKLEVKVQ